MKVKSMKNEYNFNDTLYPCLWKEFGHKGLVDLPIGTYQHINAPPPKKNHYPVCPFRDQYRFDKRRPMPFVRMTTGERVWDYPQSPTQHINQPKLYSWEMFMNDLEAEFGEGDE